MHPYLWHQNTHDTQLFTDSSSTLVYGPLPDRQRLELADDYRQPPGIRTFFHGKRLARAHISQWQRGDTRVCAKTIACTDSQRERDWPELVEAIWRGGPLR